MPEATATRTLMACGTRTAYRRHIRREEPVDEACRKAWNAYKRGLRADGAAARLAARTAREARAAREQIAGARPFYIPRCAQCRAPLADEMGEPRWDLLEGRFVCLGRCVNPNGDRRA
jgi:hypothetical protein